MPARAAAGQARTWAFRASSSRTATPRASGTRPNPTSCHQRSWGAVLRRPRRQRRPRSRHLAPPCARLPIRAPAPAQIRQRPHPKRSIPALRAPRRRRAHRYRRWAMSPAQRRARARAQEPPRRDPHRPRLDRVVDRRPCRSRSWRSPLWPGWRPSDAALAARDGPVERPGAHCLVARRARRRPVHDQPHLSRPDRADRCQRAAQRGAGPSRISASLSGRSPSRRLARSCSTLRSATSATPPCSACPAAGR